MAPVPSPALPDPRVCEQARLSRDARFDGLFFTAVITTGIYCRPVCPVRAAKHENVRYYGTAAAAEAAGFRPCLRCRPELAPGDGAWRRGDRVVARALKLIDDGLLAEASVSALAQRVGLGERQLRRLFVEQLGVPPRRVHGTRRLLFAKQLLTETELSIIEVAMEAGFGSLRRFNSSFRDAYRLTPRDLRRQPRRTSPDEASWSGDEVLTLRLAYRPPYDFPALLEFLRDRALPGVEAVDTHGYARVFGPPETPGWLRVSAWPGAESALRLELHCPRPLQILKIVTRLRRMFDLDAEPRSIAEALAVDTRLRPLVSARPGLRLPGAWDGFEMAVRAVLGQQISVAAARTVAGRLVEQFGEAVETPFPAGLARLFPTPLALANANLTRIGLTRARARTVQEVARAVLDGRLDFRPERPLAETVARWQALPGIGAWTANIIAMRALGHPDAFPAEDLILRRAAGDDAATPMSATALARRAEAWRPWRAYAVMQLWRGAN